MNVITIILACLLTILASSSVSHGKEWRGLKPLQSTREDVVRLLGHSTDSCDCLYNLGAEIVSIVYSSGPCEKGMPGGWNVPRDTVISIGVSIIPGAEPLLTDLKINESKYQKVEDPHVRDNLNYTDEVEGITISTYLGRVKRIAYTPTAKDAHLRCPDLVPVAPMEDGPATYPLGHLDIYGDISFEEEKARLDVFAAEMENKPDTRLYIIVYAGRRARLGEARARAERAKTYLVSKRGIRAQQIFATDGGYREELTVEIWFGSRGAPAPTPSPSVRPGEVEIIKSDDVGGNSSRSSRSPRKRHRRCQ